LTPTATDDRPNRLYADPRAILPMEATGLQGFRIAFLSEMLPGGLVRGAMFPSWRRSRSATTCAISVSLRETNRRRAAPNSDREILRPLLRGTRGVRSRKDHVPGDPERELLARRMRRGYPLDDGEWAEW